MATKKRNYRAEAAHRRNVEQAKIRQEAAKRKAFWDAHGKQVIIAAVCAVAVILVIWLGCKWFVGPGGSIPNWFGTLRGVEEDWIVQNLGDSRSPRYYKMAEYQAPEGYTRDMDYSISSDTLNQVMYFTADDENAVIESVYVGGVKNKTAADQVATLSTNGMFENVSETTVANMGGHEVHYVYLVTNTSPEGTPEEEYTGKASLCMYVDTVQSSSVLMMLYSQEAPLAEVTASDVMLAEAEPFVSLLTIPQ